MVGPSKILTVSYGTFSCTLEGFDDPFSTMRGIAEYFRDLAGDDRYFGAEPPTPDAEMLHRIAEKEIQRRVEARVDDNGITLRQLDDTDAVAPAALAGVAMVAAKTVAEDTPEAAAEIAEEEVVAEDVAVEAKPDVSESVAAKLARIRAAVSEQNSTPDSGYVEDQHADEMFVGESIDTAFDDYDDQIEAEAVGEVAVEAEVEVDAEAEAEVEAAAEVADVDDTLEQEADVEDAPLDLSAFIDEQAEIEPTDDAVAEDEVEEVAEATDDNIAKFFADSEVDDAEYEDDMAEEELEPAVAADDLDEDVQDAADDTVALIAEISDENTAEVEDFDDFEAPIVNDEVSEDEEVSVTAVEDYFDDADDDLDLDDVDDVAEEPALEDVAEAEAEAEAEFEDEAEVEVPAVSGSFVGAAIARVINLRSKTEVADNTNVLEVDDDDLPESEVEAEYADDLDADASSAAPVQETAGEETTLSDEDEADLMATLALVQKEHNAEDRAEKEGRAILENDDIEDNQEAVDRILEVTNTELEETEGTRRRSVIAHLKAAVQATRADKNIKEEREQEDAEELDQYREDLERVVRPRRPAANKESTSRRMPPLVLVTEQRVDETDEPDTSEDREAVVVRPRRIRVNPENATTPVEDGEPEHAVSEDIAIESSKPEMRGEDDFGSFSDFAEQMEANSLPDLLEAAAAYSSYVKGEPHFSRPQIMRAIMSYDSENEFSREDSLRSFGQLLRRGKIEKLERGRFAVSQNTRFNPQVRAAGE